MSFVGRNRINSVRPLSVHQNRNSYRWANGIHTPNDPRATLLSNNPELNDQATGKRILDQYHNQCATLGVSQGTRLQDICLLRPQLEHFIRLRYDATAALTLTHGSSTKLSKQYKECKNWLARNGPRAKFSYEAERRAVLEQYPKLAIAPIREGLRNRYNIESEKILVPRSEAAATDQPREFVAGVSHREKRQFCELALHYVVIHLIDNPITTEAALAKWKADHQRCQDTLAKLSLIPFEEEKAEALEKYPDLEDLEMCRTAINEFTKLHTMLTEKEEQGLKTSSRDLERCLIAGLKSIAAQAFLPGGDQVERRKRRQGQREYLLAELDASQTRSKGLRLWFIPDPTWIGELIGRI